MAGLELFIGNRNYSSWFLRGWSAVRAAGLAADEQVIRLDIPTTREAFMRVSPSGLVPVVHHGDVTVRDRDAVWDTELMREWREAAENEPWVIDRFEFRSAR